MGIGGLPPLQLRHGSPAAARARFPGDLGAAVSGLPALAGSAASRKEAGPPPGKKGSWIRPPVARGARTPLGPEASALPEERSFIPCWTQGITVYLTSQLLFTSGLWKLRPSGFQYAAVCENKR